MRGDLANATNSLTGRFDLCFENGADVTYLEIGEVTIPAQILVFAPRRSPGNSDTQGTWPRSEWLRRVQDFIPIEPASPKRGLRLGILRRNTRPGLPKVPSRNAA